jgi:hypothetical protein
LNISRSLSVVDSSVVGAMETASLLLCLLLFISIFLASAERAAAAAAAAAEEDGGGGALPAAAAPVPRRFHDGRSPIVVCLWEKMWTTNNRGEL